MPETIIDIEILEASRKFPINTLYKFELVRAAV